MIVYTPVDKHNTSTGVTAYFDNTKATPHSAGSGETDPKKLLPELNNHVEATHECAGYRVFRKF